MRTSSLRALLAALRAGGVSEYRETHKGTTVSIKLGGPPAVELSASERKSAAKAAQTADVEAARRRSAMLDELGITEEQFATVIPKGMQ